MAIDWTLPVTLIIVACPPTRDSYSSPPATRLRLLLKVMLRKYGWRCTSIESVPAREGN